jgi:hypothetical protein
MQQPELISLHIPKTAGTSFRNILKLMYNEDQVVRFDIRMGGLVFLNEEPYFENTLPCAKVIHGHFSYENLNSAFTIPENCPIITWLRDPVQRVVSNYYYLEARLIDILQEEKNQLHILGKMQRSLIEYARADINRNRMSQFLQGIDLKKLAFIGIQEQFATDLPLLAARLNWPFVPEIIYDNVTAEKEMRIIPEDVLEEIKALNAEDVRLFEEAKEIRACYAISTV